MKSISSLYNYYIYRNLTESLILRNQSRIIFSDDNRFALLSWGLSVFIGGEFSKSNREKVISFLKESKTPRNIYYPDNEWRSVIEDAFPDGLSDKQLNLYYKDCADISVSGSDEECIAQITPDFFENSLPGIELIKDELYSYKGTEDFLRNGFGLALVIEGKVVGYCLSEYSVGNSLGINIWIDEKYRRQGYGKKMVNNFMINCKEKGKKAYWVCNADNTPSMKTALSSGFIPEASMHYFILN